MESLLEPPEEAQLCQIRNFWTTELREQISVVSSHQVCGNWLQQPPEMNMINNKLVLEDYNWKHILRNC